MEGDIVTDTMTRRQRSYTMSRIKGHNTGPERKFAMFLVRNGFTFKRKAVLAGRPDFILKEYPVAIFIDGCFFHGCKKHCKMPKSNISFWTKKIKANKARDRRVDRALRRESWLVWRFWEHELRNSGQTRLILGRLKALQAISGALWPSKALRTRGLVTE